MSKSGRITEAEIGEAVLKILDGCPHKTATVKYLKDHITAEIVFTTDDQEISLTRDNEELWEQQVRNLKCHASAEGNIFREGLVQSVKRGEWQLTPAGSAYLKSK